MLQYVLYKSSIDIEPLSLTLHGVKASEMSNKMYKMSIIELYRLGQDLFDFSDLTWAHPLTHPSTHR